MPVSVSRSCRLSVPKSEKYEVMQEDFSGTPDRRAAACGLCRQGHGAAWAQKACFCPSLSESHVPERAARLSAACGCGNADSTVRGSRVTLFRRPALGWPPFGRSGCFQSPEPVEAVAEVPEGPPRSFRWRRSLASHRARRGAGTDRRPNGGSMARRRPSGIISGWRMKEAGASGCFAKGIMAGRAQPRWFMHGVFA